LKIVYYVEGIYYHPENPSPSVIVVLRNTIDTTGPQEPILLDSRTDIRKAITELFSDSVKYHKTSIMVTLDQYRASGIMVGDRLELETTISNNGEILS